MAATARPATPSTQSSSAPLTPQTGNWKHPRFDEIARRQNAATFSDRNLKGVLYNTGGLFALWLAEKFVRLNIPFVHDAMGSYDPYPTYLITVIRILLIFNIIVAFRPLIQRKDDLSDIPLTPAQRKLLGLGPSDTPPTPGSQYVTPPRYPRSATPQSGSPNSAYSPSPLSGRGSPAQSALKELPFSPSSSPLLSKALGGGLAGTRRPSYVSPSPLGFGTSRGNWLESPSTPSPSMGKGPSVTLNNKWLWEKGRRRSGDGRVFS